jgi:vacuolar protein sorting-associated protein 45
VTKQDKLRLALLYTLRYERNSNQKTALVRSMLQDQGVGPDDVRLMDAVLEYGGAACRESDLYGDRSFLAAMSKNVKQGLQGVSNVYAQHTPLLVNTLEQLFKGKLKNSQFPCTSGDASKERPTDVIVFILGGCTYEEELRVAAMNEKGDVNVLLGGSCVQNSKLFLEELSQTFGSGTSAFDLR